MTPKTIRARAGLPRRLAAGVALVLAAPLLAACATEAEEPIATSLQARESVTLHLGALLPHTGAAADYAPAMTAAVTLAVEEVNAARLGVTIVPEIRDSGDSSSDTVVASATELIEAGSTAIVGPLTDGASRKIIAQVVAAGVVMVSPGNRSPDFSTYADDDLYWRTAPSCDQEGYALGAAAAEHGHRTLLTLAQYDLCGAGLPLAAAAAFTAGGGKVLGAKQFQTADPIEPLVAAAVQAAPDAVAVLSADAGVGLAKALLAAGFEAEQLYFAGLPISGHAEDFPEGSLAGAHAVRAGLDLSTLESFTDRLLELDPALTEFRFAAETYDAVILLALGALAAMDDSGAQIAAQLRAVSGGNGAGQKATSFAKAARIILDGGMADYDGPSGGIAFDAEGDPAEAAIGLFEYQDDDTFLRLR